MRKLVLFIATSLDGYIARPDGGIDWLFTDQGYGYPEFFAGVDTVLMGRRTYEQLLALGGGYPYPGTRGYVFSRRRGGERNAHVAFIADDVATFVQRLKEEPGKTIWLVGGAEIARACLLHDLVDESVISVHPLVLGAGIPLFLPPLPTLRLTLARCQVYDSGLVQLTYRRERIFDLSP
ncbi:MAG: dihydrofolate reductase family protein [Gammaproteobacteria bacterium]